MNPISSLTCNNNLCLIPRKDYILSLIEQGEHEHQDFKFQISDARKIARSIAAFANNDGGRLLVGVKDNGKIAGVSSDEEIYMVEQAASMYCRPEQKPQFRLHRVEGKTVLEAIISPANEKPVLAPDENGRWRAYFRVADENIAAHPIHEQILSRASNRANHIVSFTEAEQLLLGYLANHGSITPEGYMRLAHISRLAAEMSLVNLCEIQVLRITYHDSRCVFTLA